MRIFTVLLLLGTLSASESTLRRISNAKVLSVAKCSNPEVVISAYSKHVGAISIAKEMGIAPFEFEMIKIGPKLQGYRLDVTHMGNGSWRSYSQTIYVMESTKLKVYYQLHGPYLFISDQVHNQRYAFWHWVGNHRDGIKKILKYNSRTKKRDMTFILTTKTAH